MNHGRIIELRKVSAGCPEQWEGKTAAGQLVYARERHGQVRVDLDGAAIYHGVYEEDETISLLADIETLFEVDWEKVDAANATKQG